MRKTTLKYIIIISMDNNYNT
eukprot:SAG11_NODE_31522_length_291_cov_0.807292_1_plen_20_part_10